MRVNDRIKEWGIENESAVKTRNQENVNVKGLREERRVKGKKSEEERGKEVKGREGGSKLGKEKREESVRAGGRVSGGGSEN